MTDKPELYATHPEDGKRHRWEIISQRPIRDDEFYLDGDLFAVKRRPINFQGGLPSCGSYCILRDLGPVEEEKTPERKPSDVTRDCAVSTTAGLVFLKFLGRNGSVDAFSLNVYKANHLHSELNKVLGALTKPSPAEVSRLKARAKELEDNLAMAIHILDGAQKDLQETIKSRDRIALDCQQAETRVAKIESELDAISVFNPKLGQRAKVARRLLKQLDPAHPEKDLAWWRGKAVQQEENIRFYRGKVAELEARSPAPPEELEQDKSIEALRKQNGPRPTGCNKCGLFDGRRCKVQQDFGCIGRGWIPDWCVIYPKDDKPAPPKVALGAACPRCHGTGWKVFPYSVTFAPAESDKNYSAMGVPCPDCRGSGDTSWTPAPPKEGAKAKVFKPTEATAAFGRFMDDLWEQACSGPDWNGRPTISHC